MNPWLETAGILVLGALGVWAGYGCSRLPGRWWTVGYFTPLLLVILIGLAHRSRTLEFHQPLSSLMAGRREYALLAFFGTVLLVTPMGRLPRPRDRLAVGLLAAAVLLFVSAWPFISPVFVANRQRALVTREDAHGVCLQGTDYNCGPAAAVTALRRLGFKAEEGELAVLARTSSIHGTEPDVLARTLERRYGAEGLVVNYRPFRSIDDLPRGGCTLVVVKFSFLIDHYVAVLEVGPENVVVGDPLSGREVWSRDEFLQRWRKVGIALKRVP